MTQIFAVVPPLASGGDSVINYLTTDFEKATAFATEYTEHCRKKVAEVDPDYVADYDDEWKVVEMPFEDFFYLEVYKHEIPTLKALERQRSQDALADFMEQFDEESESEDLNKQLDFFEE